MPAEVFFDKAGVRLMVGDCRDVLRDLPAESAQCCVTSPPYWGLRDYGTSGQLGLEATPAEYVAAMVEVFAEVWRVLRPDGVLWLNLGDTYATGAGAARSPGGGHFGKTNPIVGASAFPRAQPNRLPLPGLKPKDLVGIPWTVAFALRDAGWWLRSDCIWSKPNPMPESTRDRPTRAHEYVFLLTKGEHYFYDIDAVREPHTEVRANRRNKHGKSAMRGQAELRPRGNMDPDGGDRFYHPLGRNKRSVWAISPGGFAGAHFAVMPEGLAQTCILSGSRGGDLVVDPFSGAGTTSAVAYRLGRRAIGIDLNRDYCAIAAKRLDEAMKQQRLALRMGGS